MILLKVKCGCCTLKDWTYQDKKKDLKLVPEQFLSTRI